MIDLLLKVSRHTLQRKDVDYVAIQLVNNYPQCFKNNIGGILCGNGHDSLARALSDRSHYVTRKKHLTSGESKPSLKNPRREISYECSEDTWIPDITDEAFLAEKKSFLATDAHDEAVVLQLMELTKCQQQQVNLLPVTEMAFSGKENFFF